MVETTDDEVVSESAELTAIETCIVEAVWAVRLDDTFELDLP